MTNISRSFSRIERRYFEHGKNTDDNLLDNCMKDSSKVHGRERTHCRCITRKFFSQGTEEPSETASHAQRHSRRHKTNSSLRSSAPETEQHLQIPQMLGREMAKKKRSDRGRKTSHVGRDKNARSKTIPQRERQKDIDQGVLLPQKLRRTLLAWKSERQGGVHLEKMTTSPYTSPDKVGSHSSRVLYWSR